MPRGGPRDNNWGCRDPQIGLFDIIEKGHFHMEKDTIVTPTPQPKAQPRAERPVRTMSMDKAKKLIRKTSTEHAELFRRLAK